MYINYLPRRKASVYAVYQVQLFHIYPARQRDIGSIPTYVDFSKNVTIFTFLNQVRKKATFVVIVYIVIAIGTTAYVKADDNMT